MKTFAAALAFSTMLFAPTAAIAAEADAAVAQGKMLYTGGKRLAPIYRVKEDGAVQIILNGKMVTVPAATITVADGKAETNLGRPELLASR